MTSRVAIIPARGGSRRIHEKNIKLFHGKPIIAYSIETALASGLFDKVVVSTDCQKIADISEIYGATVLKRDKAHSEDHIGTQDVARYVLDQLSARGENFDLACVIYATAPMMTADDLRIASSSLEDDVDLNFVMSIGCTPLSDAAQFYFGRPAAFGTYPLISPDCTGLQLTQKERVCDINTPDDWLRAEKMYFDWKTA